MAAPNSPEQRARPAISQRPRRAISQRRRWSSTSVPSNVIAAWADDASPNTLFLEVDAHSTQITQLSQKLYDVAMENSRQTRRARETRAKRAHVLFQLVEPVGKVRLAVGQAGKAGGGFIRLQPLLQKTGGPER